MDLIELFSSSGVGFFRVHFSQYKKFYHAFNDQWTLV